MATPAQIQANRRNSVLSTGPRSEEGKAVSRFNALKTGIQAKSRVIPGEDAAELEQLAAGYHLQFQPSSPLERFLVDTLVDAEWQLRRYHAVEARLWEHSLGLEDSNLGQAFGQGLQTFTRLHRRIEALERSYFRALQQLQRLQAQSVQDWEMRNSLHRRRNWLRSVQSPSISSAPPSQPPERLPTRRMAAPAHRSHPD